MNECRVCRSEWLWCPATPGRRPTCWYAIYSPLSLTSPSLWPSTPMSYSAHYSNAPPLLHSNIKHINYAFLKPSSSLPTNTYNMFKLLFTYALEHLHTWVLISRRTDSYQVPPLEQADVESSTVRIVLLNNRFLILKIIFLA